MRPIWTDHLLGIPCACAQYELTVYWAFTAANMNWSRIELRSLYLTCSIYVQLNIAFRAQTLIMISELQLGMRWPITSRPPIQFCKERDHLLTVLRLSTFCPISITALALKTHTYVFMYLWTPAYTPGDGQTQEAKYVESWPNTTSA